MDIKALSKLFLRGETVQINDEPLSEEEIRDFLGWRYPPPYQIYNLEVQNVDDAIAFFLTPESGYLAVRDDEGAVVGFCCFGFEGQVPGGDYSVDALDVGIGMRPELTGQGLGYDFVAAVLAYAEERFAPQRLRATIALFNRRSQRVFENHGFRRQSQFAKTTPQGRQYVILIKEVERAEARGVMGR